MRRAGEQAVTGLFHAKVEGTVAFTTEHRYFTTRSLGCQVLAIGDQQNNECDDTGQEYYLDEPNRADIDQPHGYGTARA
jgi:hypothetical protein